MKQLFVVGLVILSLSSCRKDRVCNCEYQYQTSGKVEHDKITFKKMSKSGAEKNCSDLNGTRYVGAPYNEEAKIVCAIEK